MARIIFRSPDGAVCQVDASAGRSVMQAAIDAGVPGIVAECGGACVCATCHCYVDAEWLPRLPEPDAHERDLLQCAWQPNGRSRLSCQIQVSQDIDGLVVDVPERQQ